MENCIHATLEYARQRHIYGRPLLDNQVVHFRLAELQTEVEALRSLLYRALGKYAMHDQVYELCDAVSIGVNLGGLEGRDPPDFEMGCGGGLGVSMKYFYIVLVFLPGLRPGS